MFYQLLILAIVLGLIAFYAFEGLFNALIAAVCAISAAAVAFNFFEPLARAMGDSATALQIGPAVALAALFVVVMEAARFGATKLVPGMVHFPLLADRIGGAVLGAIPALLVAGVLAISLRLLPFGPSLMGYKSLVSPPTGQGQLVVEPLWLRPDAFTVGVANTLSAGSLWGGQSFSQVHPDYLAELSGFNDYAGETKDPVTANALEELRLFKPGEKTPVRGALVRGEFRDPARGEIVPADWAKRTDARTLALTVCPRRLDDEDAILLAAPQAQLTCRSADGSARMIVPQFIAENPKKPSDVQPFPILNAWRGKAPQNITLFYAVPKDFTPAYLTVKGDTHVEPEIRGEKDTWTVQPAAPQAEPGGGIATTWLISGGWTKAVSAETPVVLIARPSTTTSPDAEVNAQLKSAGARVTLTPDRLLATARVAGPESLMSIGAGSQIIKLSVPVGMKVVQLKCSPGDAIRPADWTALLSTAVMTADDNKPARLAGFAVVYTTNRDERFCYDPAPDAKFADFAPPADRADIDRLTLLILVPLDAHTLKLDISRELGLQMQVDLGR